MSPRTPMGAAGLGLFATLLLTACQAPLPRPTAASVEEGARSRSPMRAGDREAARARSRPAGQVPADEAATADESNPHMVAATPDAAAIADTPPAEPELWQRLRTGFEFVECTPVESMRASLRQFAAHPDAFQRMLGDAIPHLDYVARRLADAGIPAEFALLPMVESRYLVYPNNPGTRGPAGPWQLMPRTARANGLRVTREYDARLDLVASTGAAIRLLQSLHAQFENWTLVNLAFNAGDGRVRGALRRAGGWHGDPYALRLSPITRAHFSRLRALVCIFTDPAGHGLQLPAAPLTRLHASPIRDGQDVAALARELGVSPGELSRHNPMLKGKSRTPAGMREVLVTLPLANGVAASATRPASADAATVYGSGAAVPDTPATHVVAKGDSLWTVSRRYRVSLENLRRWNALNVRALLRPGQILRLTGD